MTAVSSFVRHSNLNRGGRFMCDNPWQHPLDGRRNVLPKDEAMVLDFNAHASKDHKLAIDDVLPEPFVGDPNAPVVILGNSPGFSPEKASHRQAPRFMARMCANLRHQPSDHPFVFLAPDIDGPHRRWWERKLKGLLHYFDQDHELLARSIFAVE